MNETLFKIHDVDIDAVGLGDFGKRGTFVQSEQFTNWELKWSEIALVFIYCTGALARQSDTKLKPVSTKFQLGYLRFLIFEAL